jgi:hypothetical protein
MEYGGEIVLEYSPRNRPTAQLRIGNIENWQHFHIGNNDKAYTMTATERKKLQRDFLRRVGPNAETFKALFDTLPDATFYMMDDQDRIMAYRREHFKK